MKKILAAVLVLGVLSGCTGATYGVPKIDPNDKMFQCDKVSSSTDIDKPTSKRFAGILEFQAFMAKSQRDTYQLKIKTMGLYGFEDNVYNKISDCYYKNINILKDDTAKAFDFMKKQTTNKDQKNALVEAYSAWEVYMNQLPSKHNHILESDMNKAIAKYKNM
ncbi:hypothetical protein RHA65_11795 [Providencia rettgeri]|uniref:hypothetical protein n=1 Tax=Providencia rettgeri TaxID=587 RepID=UPI001B363C74|nr:hypothetical protein [Providencia rettgeri]MBQ0210128.1 hypothetical protein [Providencia rettgeri]MDR9615309.1 hypothetical protein [Providencia rettgeri]